MASAKIKEFVDYQLVQYKVQPYQTACKNSGAPATFPYKQDPQAEPQYGLMAEEVAKVYPEVGRPRCGWESA
jgi:hypothetical protein